VRNERYFNVTALDFGHQPHAIEWKGRSPYHAAQLLLDARSDLWKVLSENGNTLLVRKGIMPPPVPPDGAMAQALRKAKEGQAPALSVPPPPQAPPLKIAPVSKMKRVREALEPLIPQLPTPFRKKHVEDLLREHGHSDVIDKHSVSNVLNAYCSESPLRHIKRWRDPATNKALDGSFEVLEEFRNQGRKAAKRAARKNGGTDHAAAPAMLNAAEPIAFDPTNAALGNRNSAYAQAVMRGGTNGAHPPEALPPAAAEAPVPPPSAEPAPAAEPPRVTPERARIELLALLSTGFLEGSDADMAEFRAAGDALFESIDRMNAVVKKVQGHLTTRGKLASLLNCVS
jgi:hypothetical protein